eukprot:1159782-Pelagomonas_calceolata.AAC.5
MSLLPVNKPHYCSWAIPGIGDHSGEGLFETVARFRVFPYPPYHDIFHYLEQCACAPNKKEEKMVNLEKARLQYHEGKWGGLQMIGSRNCLARHQGLIRPIKWIPLAAGCTRQQTVLV